jgi:hypothetical protein
MIGGVHATLFKMKAFLFIQVSAFALSQPALEAVHTSAHVASHMSDGMRSCCSWRCARQVHARTLSRHTMARMARMYICILAIMHAQLDSLHASWTSTTLKLYQSSTSGIGIAFHVLLQEDAAEICCEHKTHSYRHTQLFCIHLALQISGNYSDRIAPRLLSPLRAGVGRCDSLPNTRQQLPINERELGSSLQIVVCCPAQYGNGGATEGSISGPLCDSSGQQQDEGVERRIHDYLLRGACSRARSDTSAG